ncbi:MAG: hypothetical protein LBG80_09150 [Bacteroidales bacterium]|jgi:hypothetical protein|nr:hypothetical protein [Bacteroidales bacterium]
MKTINDLKNIKSLIIRGSQNSGKSTTIQEVCKQLNYSEVCKLNFDKKILKKSTIDKIFNGTYIIHIGEELILIIAGALTEQKKSIRIILELCIELQIEISFVLSARRFAERNDFNTTNNAQRLDENDPSSSIATCCAKFQNKTEIELFQKWDKTLAKSKEREKIKTFPERREVKQKLL